MIKTSILYAFAGLMRFVFVIYATLRTVQLLRVEEYSLLGIANVFAMLVSLLWFFNFDSSFQKMYSKNRLRKTVNFVVLITFVTLTFCFILLQSIFWFVLKNFNIEWDFIEVTQINYFPHYCLLVALNPFVLSLVNSKRMQLEYIIQMTVPSLIVAVYLFSIKEINLQSVFILHTFALLSSISVIVCLNIKMFRMQNYKLTRSNIVLKYMFNYTFRSIPTISTKYLLDLVIRSIILQKFGHLQLASYNLCQNLLGIMRTLEQSLARAVTPYILRDTNKNLSNLLYARALIILQTFITAILVSTSYFWLPILSQIIKNKPENLYSPPLLILLGGIVIAGYWKNYSLMYMKKYSVLIKTFYNQTTYLNILLILIFLLTPSNLYVLLITQLFLLILHNIVLRFVIHKKIALNTVNNKIESN